MSDIKESLKKYIDARLQLTELQWKEELAILVSKAIYFLLIMLAVGFGASLLSIALALWLGALLGASYWGFLIVGGLFALSGWYLYRSKDTTTLLKKLRQQVLEQVFEPKAGKP